MQLRLTNYDYSQSLTSVYMVMTTDHQCLKETPTEIVTHLKRHAKEASIRCLMRPRTELRSGQRSRQFHCLRMFGVTRVLINCYAAEVRDTVHFIHVCTFCMSMFKLLSDNFFINENDDSRYNVPHPRYIATV